MKINITNIEKIQATLKEIQGRSRERIYDADDIQEIVRDFVQRMARLGVSRAKLNGCKIEFGGNYKPASAYRYPFIGTVGTITFSSKGAYLTALMRTICNRSKGVTLGDATKEAIIKNVEKLDY
jgi:hypothetical protein